MAISGTHYQLLKSIRHVLPPGGSLLEIGEANWYGDVEPDFPCRDTSCLFAIARDCYRSLFETTKIVSIDFNGSPDALRYDLNQPLPYCLDGSRPEPDVDDPFEEFDLVINHGTAEHIFNIAHVFSTMHDRCIDGGVMIHESPFTGWIDHGFYCLQPTLFYDVAAANGYEIVLVAIEQIDSGTIIRLESRDHVASLAKSEASWTTISNGKEHAVVAGFSAVPIDMLKGKVGDSPDCSSWVRAWCPSLEIARQIAAEHNAKSRLPNNAMLYVVYRKRGDKAFRVPMQGYYDGRLSPQGKRAWEELR